MRNVLVVGLTPTGAEEHESQVAVGIFTGEAHIPNRRVRGRRPPPRIAILTIRGGGIQIINLAHGADAISHKQVLVGAGVVTE